MKDYIVLNRVNNKTRNGADYIQLKVTDGEDIVSISVWDIPADKGPKYGQLVNFKNIKDNGGKKSCSSLDLVEGQMAEAGHPLYDKLPHPVSKEAWEETISQLLKGCTHDKLKAIIQDCAAKMYPRYSAWPAATAMHHAFPGGLLNHTHQMLRMLLGIYPCLPNPIRLERCILGVLFHDYGKLKEYDQAGKTQPDMYLLGHIYIGAHALQNELEKQGIDKEETKRIVHCVLAHHGQLEYGSPVLPCTQEAALVSFLDIASAKSDTIESTGNMDYAYSIGTHVIKG